MRDINRIKRILKLLETLWRNASDERFGQLLINLGVCDDESRLWSNEDEDVEKHLKTIIKKEGIKE